jgi:hypothetical protein
MERVSLLLSHLPKQISGQDEPIKQLKIAAKFLKSKDITIVTSTGQTHWDCILSAALCDCIPVHLIIVTPMTIADVTEQFNCEFTSYEIVGSRELRDDLVCLRSDCLYPLWIRRGGHISRLISDPAISSRVDWRFDCSAYKFRNSGLKYLSSKISSNISSLPDGYFWHWTRGRHGVWLGETCRDYCNDILNSNAPPRNAIATLIRILQERKIRASGLHIAGNIPVTSFTSNHPTKSTEMFTWRNDLQQMNFEQYGIGIDESYAKEKGTTLLKYGKTPDWNTMQTDNRWKNENEWRFRGDFVLDDECWEKMIVVVRKQHEIEQVKKLFNVKVIAFEEN